MKKVILSFALLAMPFLAFAGSEVNVVSGDPTILISGSSTASVTIDYSNAVVEGDMKMADYIESRGEDYAADWPGVKEKVMKYFIGNFNRKNKDGMQVSAGDGSEKYNMLITITELELGSTAKAFTPTMNFKLKDGGAIISGTVVITDVATNEAVCEISFENVAAGPNSSETTRLGMAMMTLAGQLKSAAKKL